MRLSADRCAGRLNRAACSGVGRNQHTQGIAVGEIPEGFQRGRVVLGATRRAAVGLAVTCPDQALVCPGQYCDCLGICAVAGDRAPVVSAGARQIGQQFGIAGMRFGS
jgi:hypothetical protein